MPGRKDVACVRVRPLEKAAANSVVVTGLNAKIRCVDQNSFIVVSFNDIFIPLNKKLCHTNR